MASTSRLLLLRRGDHNSRLTEGFETLLDKESMTDVSITCGQQIIKAHRTVLSIFSPFFKRVFDSIESPMHYPFIVLKDMPYQDLMAIIDLMYRGEVTVNQEQFTSLKKSAKILEVSELSDIISSYEERNDIKPKTEDNISSSGGRNTRKRGRPKRYCEDSDEEFKISDSPPPPPTKRQQALQSTRAAATATMPTTSMKKTIVQTITPAAKTPTATRGGAHLSFSKQPSVRVPTAIRGGHSAFSKPQTATRGGYTGVTQLKPQIATRGSAKGLTTRTRNSRGQYSGDIDEDFHPSQETIRRSTPRRGRPPRTASLTREDDGMPMATSLPVSLPEPISVDLGNIFPNYNLNDVSSSTSTAQKTTVSVQFEQTIKQEPDSDSEVECIMSATSPLPSGVLDECPEIIDNSINEVSTNSDTNSQSVEAAVIPEHIISNEVSVEATEGQRNASPDNRNEVELIETGLQTNALLTNIKTEEVDTPEPDMSQIEEQTQESAVSSVRTDNTITNEDIPVVTTTPSVEPSMSATLPNTSSNIEVRNPGSVPILRFIKRERISPTPVVQTSFQTIEDQTNDGSNSCEPISSVSVPVLTRVKIERKSPQNVNKSIIDISTENEDNSQTANDSSDVSSSHNQEFSVQITKVFSAHDSPPASQSDDQQSSAVTATDNSECTSSSGQQTNPDNSQTPVLENRDSVNEIDGQEIAFDCFYGSDEQQMQTYSSEVATSAPFNTTDVNTFLGLNTTSDNTIDRQNNQFIKNSTDFTQIPNNSNQMSFATTSDTNAIITSSDPTQQRFFTVNTTQQMTNTSNTNTFTMDNNNVVMNSPVHSDEECMLLDSPQQSTAYEVTIGSEPNLDDSMDNL